jgi:hypothetical protein
VTAVTGATPRDFTVLLPPGWVRLPLDGTETAQAAEIAAARTAQLPQPQRDEVRQALMKLMRTALREARMAGGIDVLLSLAEWRGIGLPASCLVSYLDQDGQRVPLDRLRDELAKEGGDVSGTEIARGPAVRRRHAENKLIRLDYFLPVPGRTGLLTLAFATPVEPLADPLVMLFDAIAESLRWRP